MKYCESIYQTLRRKTREVMVGNVGVGGDNPVRTQSMTTSNTRDVEATVEQIIRLADCGCEIARVTVQGMKEADACEGIKNGLIQKGYTIPLVADIHFYPPAALRVADYADKVRINPGNFVDKRAQFKTIDYDEKTYLQELERLEEKFAPLVEKCKRLGRAMRIGTNHGSLSDRIMNQYGDTAAGMVESAFEFARVCRKYDYHDFIFSMKASNTKVMIEAYRLLVAEMNTLEWDYPLHLGVTEAGEGEDGRVKSAIGMGALLLDGLGDTVRVSLTEDPWHEINPCKRLVAFGKNSQEEGIAPFEETFRKVSSSSKREVTLPSSFHRDGSVFLKVSQEEVESPMFFSDIGCQVELGRPKRQEGSVDGVIAPFSHPKLEKLREAGIAILQNPVLVTEDSATWKQAESADYVLFAPTSNPIHEGRRFFQHLAVNNLNIPVILSFAYTCALDDLPIHAAAENGSLLCDEIGEGICVGGPYPLSERRSLSFAILQGARMRQSKTEFISCPGCGRTLFDLQETAAKIRERTGHLPGVKIAVMGCIVNGPGEMADADFGYVGSRSGRIDLYIGKTCVERNIDMNEAVDRLVALIQSQGRWVEKEPLQSAS
ncbi:MAG: 4-hydroxy-3-methylbut-2-en-1-yl diphosphate synthase (ferredoxin) [Chlamydiae bacterium]|nr:4-hydroxy-3-methylbut-2-en-1-yl diphosphate synthase (ferredoxin) [Chlamydiota bacterium]